VEREGRADKPPRLIEAEVEDRVEELLALPSDAMVPIPNAEVTSVGAIGWLPPAG
jgi:hypothetical protein